MLTGCSAQMFSSFNVWSCGVHFRASVSALLGCVLGLGQPANEPPGPHTLLSRPTFRDGKSFRRITGEREYGTSARLDGADLRRPPPCVAGRRLGDVPGRADMAEA